ncbi:MAG: maleylpyruvate isomerase N-terminal domain-containing protein [Acidimicrobiia bacterium]
MDVVIKAFAAAAGTFDGLLDAPEVTEAWEKPSALAGYTVGGIVGHVSVALAWTEPLLAAPEPSDLRPIRLGNYYTGLKITEDTRHPMHDAIRDRSESSAGHGPAETAARFRALIERLLAGLADEPGDRILDMRPLVPAAVRLDDFLRTRVLELVVHADDLAASVALEPPQPSPEAMAAALDVLLDTARTAHGDLAVLRALARKERAAPDVFPVF